MATVSFHFEPKCGTAVCDSPFTYCVSLYRGPRPGPNGSTIPAISYYECFEGNTGLSGERIARHVLHDVKKRTGIQGLSITHNSDSFFGGVTPSPIRR